MKKINLNETSEIPYEDGIQSVERIPEEEKEQSDGGSSLLQKLTLISFMAICAVIIVFSLQLRSYFQAESKYKIPEDAVLTDSNTDTSSEEQSQQTQSEQKDDNVEYVEQVVYNPTKAAEKELKEAHDGKDWSSTFRCPNKWEFKSSYDYSRPSIGCVWICKNTDTDEIISIRTATYDGVNDVFDDIQFHTTKIGGKYIAAD